MSVPCSSPWRSQPGLCCALRQESEPGYNLQFSLAWQMVSGLPLKTRPFFPQPSDMATPAAAGGDTLILSRGRYLSVPHCICHPHEPSSSLVRQQPHTSICPACGTAETRYHMFQGRNSSASRGFPDRFFLIPVLKVILFSIPINGC